MLIRPPIIYRYIFKEIVSPFAIALFVFTGILFLVRSLKLIDLVVNKNVPAGDILLLFSYIIPRFLEIAVPMSLLLAIILAFGRLSSDSELVVIRATGVSLKRLAIPVLFFSGSAFLFSLLLTFWIRPWANHQLGMGMFEIAKTQASAGLVAGVFNELGQLTVYAESITDNGQTLSNVIIGDRRNLSLPRTFIAKHGKIVSDRIRRRLVLKLYQGHIIEGTGLDFNLTRFETNSLNLPQSELIDETPTADGKKGSEMFIGELINALKQIQIGISQMQSEPQLQSQEASENKGSQMKMLKEAVLQQARYKVELQSRFALPFACLCISLIAMALGIQPSRGGHTWGAATNVAVGILLILLYYVLFAIAGALGEQNHQPTWLLIWAPNILFAAIGIYLFEKMGSEQWMAVTEALGDKISWLGSQFRNKSELHS